MEEREGMDVPTLASQGWEHAKHTSEMEEKGYRTVSWQVVEQIQQQLSLDTLVGPSAWEAAPTFGTWIPGYDANVLPVGSCPLVMLDAIPEDLRAAAVSQAMRCDQWAVIGAWGVQK